MQKALLFDFDGTLANTLLFITKILMRRSHEFGLSDADGSVIADLRDKNIWEAIRSASISLFKLPFIIKACQHELYAHMQHIGLSRENLPRMLCALRRKGYILGVVTSNSKKNVKLFFFKEKELEFFDFIYFGKSLSGKRRVIRRVLKTRHLNPELTFYIRDETRDVPKNCSTSCRTLKDLFGSLRRMRPRQLDLCHR